MAGKGGGNTPRQHIPDDEHLPTLYAELLACLRSGIATAAIAQHLASLSEHVVCASVSHRAPRDASTGQDMMDEHYNFAVQGTLGRMPWPANQTLAADVMLKGKARRFNLESSTDPIRFRDASFAAGLYKTPLLVCAPLPCHSPAHCNQDASGYCVICGRLPTADAISLGALTVGVAPGAGSLPSATQHVLHQLQRWAAFTGPRLAKDLPTRFTTATQPLGLRTQAEQQPPRSMPRATVSSSEPSTHTTMLRFAEHGWSPLGPPPPAVATPPNPPGAALPPLMAALLQAGGASALLPSYMPPGGGGALPPPGGGGAQQPGQSTCSMDSLLHGAAHQPPALSCTSSTMQSLLAVLQPPAPAPVMGLAHEQQRQLLQVLQTMLGGTGGAMPTMGDGPPPPRGVLAPPPGAGPFRPPALPAQLHATSRPEVAQDMSERARLLDQLAQLARQGAAGGGSPTLALSQTRKRERGADPATTIPRVPSRQPVAQEQDPDPPVGERGSTVDGGSDLDDSGDSGPSASALQWGARGSRSGRTRQRQEDKETIDTPAGAQGAGAQRAKEDDRDAPPGAAPGAAP